MPPAIAKAELNGVLWFVWLLIWVELNLLFQVSLCLCKTDMHSDKAGSAYEDLERKTDKSYLETL